MRVIIVYYCLLLSKPFESKCCIMKVTNLIFVVYYNATATVYRGMDAMENNYLRFLLDLSLTMLHDVIIPSKDQ